VCFIGLACPQGSTWLIDLYWTLAPPMLAAFYLTHPLASSPTGRQVVATLLLTVWSLHLTHSYLRREQYQLGRREDWRYVDMRAQYGHWWTLVQVWLSQSLPGACE
jgi:steroid 5-alpha reductase family enzyme